jgi:hypothetical protein
LAFFSRLGTRPRIPTMGRGRNSAADRAPISASERPTGSPAVRNNETTGAMRGTTPQAERWRSN